MYNSVNHLNYFTRAHVPFQPDIPPLRSLEACCATLTCSTAQSATHRGAPPQISTCLGIGSGLGPQLSHIFRGCGLFSPLGTSSVSDASEFFAAAAAASMRTRRGTPPPIEWARRAKLDSRCCFVRDRGVLRLLVAGARAAVFNLRNMHKLKMIKNANGLSYKKYIPASSSARPCIPAQGSGAIAIGSEDHRPRHGGDHAGKRPDARLDHRADDPERLDRWIGWRRQ